MKLIAISVEGQTEERFVKQVLLPYFIEKDVYIEPISMTTSRTPRGNKKGGIIKFDKTVKELERLLNRKYQLVTTFYDYYGIEQSFLPEEKFDNPYLMVEAIENKLAIAINNKHFLPYIQLHEFETFLFIDSQITSDNLYKCNKNEIIRYINQARIKNGNNPELINTIRETSPSHRIKGIYPDYQKTIDGPNICTDLGIQKLIDNCPNFKKWIDKILKFTLI